MSKIGKSILLAVDFMVVLAMTTIIVSLSLLFSDALTENTKENAQIASNVLNFDLTSRASETEMIANLMSMDSTFIDAVENGDKQTMLDIWNNIDKSDSIFGLFVNSDGILAMKTDNCKISSESIFDCIGKGKSCLSPDSEVSLYYRSVAKNEGITVIVGYAYNDNTAVDGVLEQTGSQATIFCDNTRIATTFKNEDGTRAVGTTMLDSIYEKVVKNGEIYQKETTIFGSKYMATYTPIYNENNMTVGAYFTGFPMDSVIESRNSAIIIGIIIGVVMLIIAMIGTTVFVKNQIVKPVDTVKEIAAQMEQGQLSLNSENIKKLRRNEIGDAANSISSAMSILSSYVNDISMLMREMAKGNFGCRSNVDYKGDFVSIGESVKVLGAKMSDVINGINASADEVFSGSKMISTGSSSLADGSARQASAAEELSASIAKITDNIRINAENSEKAQKLSNNSIDMVNSQNDQINNMLSAMTDIETSADEISKIIKTIEDIAFQTNILALNAAVEAARAGAAGKGFAVVADEVRNLATKSAEAANSTSSLISNCIDAVSNGSDIAQSTAEAMKKVIAITGETNELIENIAHQTNLQSQAVQQIKSEVDNISDVIRQNSATAEESAASCEQLNTQANVLRQKISVFHT